MYMLSKIGYFNLKKKKTYFILKKSNKIDKNINYKINTKYYLYYKGENMKKIMKIALAIVILLISISIVSAEYQNPIENITLDKFKESCVEVSYYDLNDNIIGQPIKLHGVIEVLDSDSMLFNINGDSNQQVYVHLKPDNNIKYDDYKGKESTIYCIYQGKFDVPFMGEKLELSLADIE